MVLLAFLAYIDLFMRSRFEQYLFTGALGLLAFFSVSLASFYLGDEGNRKGVVLPAGSLSSEEFVLAATTTVRWAGYSTTTYDGDLGGGITNRGVKGGNGICQANYPGSVWARSPDIIGLGSQYPWTQNAWIGDFYFITIYDCFHYTSNNVGDFGTCVNTLTVYKGDQSACGCTETKYIPCVYLP